MSVIDLYAISRTIGGEEEPEHPFARRVGYMLAMRVWREEWRRAEAAKEYQVMDWLDRHWETIQSVY